MKIQQNPLKIFIALLCLIISLATYSQESKVQINNLTKDDILNMSYDQLLNMPFQDLINLANIVGVSTEKLLEMILNKDVQLASKSTEKVLQSPLSATVISKEDLDKSGATSIAEALRLVPGMIVREKTPGNYDIHIRGNDNIPPKNMYVYSEDALTLVMIDNRPVYNYAFGGTFWETLPVDINDVERIEVIRGPSSALYGPNAVAGVINIITRHPENNKLSANGNFQYGTQNTAIANLGVSGGLSDKLKIRISGNYQHRERFENDFYVFGLNKFMTYNQMDTLTNYWMTGSPQQKTLAESNFNNEIISSSLSMDKYAGNAFIFYDLNKDFNLSVSGGFQRSEIVTTSLGNHSIPYSGRQSHTQFIDLKSKIYNFSFQCNYMFGDQQIERGDPAWHIEPRIFNSQLEYEYKIDKLVVRPGISYQQADYTDQDYVNISKNEGFLNGNKELNGIAGFIRGDYKPFKRLRLIAALRADKYNVPDKTYVTYQFISTYNLNENNILRAVYSRANRGPFIVDSYADFNWQIVPNFYNLLWKGNQDLNLPVMNMLELGFRTKVVDRVMIDIEAFYTNMNNFSYFKPDSLSLIMNWSSVLGGTSATPLDQGITGLVKYHNFDLQTEQFGATCNLNVVINKNVNFRIFGTLQNTRLNNFYPNTIWTDFSNMTNANLAAIQADGAKLAAHDPTLIGYLMTNNGIKVYTSGNAIAGSELINTTNQSTPTFFGGASIDYTPFDKLNIFSTGYFYSGQKIETNQVDVSNALNAANMYTVEPKIIVDLKISYKIWKENRIFFNARNLFNNTKREFAYTDKIGGTYLGGLTLSF